MLLANVSGKMAAELTPVTDSDVCMTNPSVVQIHDKLNANTRMSRSDNSTPTMPPAGRKPSTSPSTITTITASA